VFCFRRSYGVKIVLEKARVWITTTEESLSSDGVVITHRALVGDRC